MTFCGRRLTSLCHDLLLPLKGQTTDLLAHRIQLCTRYWVWKGCFYFLLWKRSACQCLTRGSWFTQDRNDANSVKTVCMEQLDIFALSSLFHGVYLWTAIKWCLNLNTIELCMSFFIFPSNTRTHKKRGVLLGFRSVTGVTATINLYD